MWQPAEKEALVVFVYSIWKPKCILDAGFFLQFRSVLDNAVVNVKYPKEFCGWSCGYWLVYTFLNLFHGLVVQNLKKD